ncbi:hypothetical protein G7085_21105 [Tessaracoccus sp. HDW20]|nr:hypothetical protein [Tessaracoccus coleopterorum]NHB86182.1 hypothetical protein [Tessaracoccus coleopterorum]
MAAAAAAAATGLLAWRVDDPWVLLVGCIFVVGEWLRPGPTWMLISYSMP